MLLNLNLIVLVDMRDTVNSGNQVNNFSINPTFKQLNPNPVSSDNSVTHVSSPPKKAVHFLKVDGIKQYKALYIPQFLESENA